MFLLVSCTLNSVNTENLRRLGQHVTSRRTAIGYKTRVAFAAAIDISDRVMGDIENGYREAGAGTYAIIENGLGWKPGSIRDVLEGGEPTPLPTQTTYSSPTDLTVIPTDDLLREIRRRIPESVDHPQERESGPWGSLHTGAAEGLRELRGEQGHQAHKRRRG